MELIAGAGLRKRLEADPPLISGLIDPEIQIQMNGVDLTVREIAETADAGPGRVDFDNASRRIPDAGFSGPHDPSGWRLGPGAYWIRFNEVVNIPTDVFAIGRPRSSLLRCGAHVGTALWDSGYRGRSSALLAVHHPRGLLLGANARVAQLAFFRLDAPAERAYSGVFQDE